MILMPTTTLVRAYLILICSYNRLFHSFPRPSVLEEAAVNIKRVHLLGIRSCQTRAFTYYCAMQPHSLTLEI